MAFADLFLPLLLASVFAATAVLTLAVTAPDDSPATRLARYARYSERLTSPGIDIETLGARERLLRPMVRQFTEWVARSTPTRSAQRTQSELVMAGSRVSVATFLAVSSLTSIGLPVLAAFYALASGPPASWTLVQWVVIGLALVWGRRLPRLWLRRRMRARQHRIDRRLPYAIDLMVACLEGGLSLDASLVKVAEQSTGPLALEIRRTLHEMTLGRPSAEAIRDLGERTGAAGLKRLTEDIVQAERMGVSIGDALRTLAHDTRLLRRQWAEEAARKAPVKMVPVLIFCVLPALAIVTVLPAGILLMRTLART